VYALEKPNQLVRRDFAAAMAHLAELKKQLVAGRDFELMAKIETEDPGSKTGGGDLGLHHAREDQQQRGSLPEAVLDAAFALPVGGLSEPIRAPQGCWLIKVLAAEPEPSDAELVQRMRDQIVDGMSQQIVKDAKIQFAQ
jgi:parvulin-like peptidyl-prolyl isomerase